jgi:hypothetical protein
MKKKKRDSLITTTLDTGSGGDLESNTDTVKTEWLEGVFADYRITGGSGRDEEKAGICRD